MEIIGGGSLPVYPAEHELPHQPGPNGNWQESYVLVWADPKQSIGGFFRLSHEKGGKSALWVYVFSPEGSYYQCNHLPIRPQDRLKNGFVSGDGKLRYEYDGQITWALADKDISVSLRVEDFHAAVNGYNPGKSNLDDVAGSHVEVAGRATGSLSIKGKAYQVDALCMRDHGWGDRDWSLILAHRWNVGVFDKDHSFCAITFLGANNQMVKFGWVIRGDKAIYSKKVEVLATMECDSFTNRGGLLRMTLTTGEIVEAKFEPFAPCPVFEVHGSALADNVCRVTWGDRVGIGCFETSSNLRAGTRELQALDGGINVDGWYPGIEPRG